MSIVAHFAPCGIIGARLDGPELTENAPLMSPVAKSEAPSSPVTADEIVQRLELAWDFAFDKLREMQRPPGNWVGSLSTSALSTATAISALVETRNHHCIAATQADTVNDSIRIGCQWLLEHQNRDGGFGDTDRSQSNIATTLLVIAAWELAGKSDLEFQRATIGPLRKAWTYVDSRGRWQGLRERYGKDKTFVVPILSNCALAGLVPWTDVSPLPFEAAWLPQDWYRWARMPVVSYAIPALVAIGQARFLKAPPGNALLKRVRRRALQPTLRVLRRMQPSSGGYLEAVPLTSFVLMNLAAVGHGSLPVAQECLRFILDSRLPDGSWPIDTNLATWLTSLAINGVARRHAPMVRLNLVDQSSGEVHLAVPQARPSATSARTQIDAQECSVATVRWLLRCQHKQRHPFTGANPGGWGWTDLSGAVPDADDTPAALLALHALNVEQPELIRLKQEIELAATSGMKWLLRLQNRDGGWPTFCRGWGKLPFDRSGTDLTAHAIRALHAWGMRLGDSNSVVSGNRVSPSAIDRALTRGLRFLAKRQQIDGSWLPLWFGNQDRLQEDNPIYGTGKVLLAYSAIALPNCVPARRGIEFLRNCQNPDGGWGGGPSVVYHDGILGYDGARYGLGSNSSIEETAVALEGLVECGGDPRSDPTIMRGLGWLVDRVQQVGLELAQPIGFYFAKLWYYEELYPTVFSLGALGSALRKIEQESKCELEQQESFK